MLLRPTLISLRCDVLHCAYRGTVTSLAIQGCAETETAKGHAHGCPDQEEKPCELEGDELQHEFELAAAYVTQNQTPLNLSIDNKLQVSGTRSTAWHTRGNVWRSQHHCVALTVAGSTDCEAWDALCPVSLNACWCGSCTHCTSKACLASVKCSDLLNSTRPREPSGELQSQCGSGQLQQWCGSGGVRSAQLQQWCGSGGVRCQELTVWARHAAETMSLQQQYRY